MGRGKQKVGKFLKSTFLKFLMRSMNRTINSNEEAGKLPACIEWKLVRFAGQKSLGRLEQAGARRARSNVRIIPILQSFYSFSFCKVGIIAAYQKTMAERMVSTEEEREVEKEVEKEVVIEEKEMEEEEESLEDLPVFERQTKGRATVCLGDMKPR